MFKIESNLLAYNFPELKSNYFDTHEKIMKEIVNCEEKTIISVIEELTKKPFNRETASRIRRIFKKGFPDKYILAYDEIPLGMIKYKYTDSSFVVEFVPGEVSF